LALTGPSRARSRRRHPRRRRNWGRIPLLDLSASRSATCDWDWLVYDVINACLRDPAVLGVARVVLQVMQVAGGGRRAARILKWSVTFCVLS